MNKLNKISAIFIIIEISDLYAAIKSIIFNVYTLWTNQREKNHAAKRKERAWEIEGAARTNQDVATT